MASFLGKKVLLITDDGKYSGTLQSIDPSHGRMTLENVTSLPSKKKLAGVLHFYKKEIKRVELAEDSPTKVSKEDDKAGPRIMKNKQTPPHLKNMKEVDRSKMYLRHTQSSGDETDKASTPRGQQDKTGLNGQQEINTDAQTDARCPAVDPLTAQGATGFTVVGTMSAQFYTAIAHIKSHSIIGVSMEGVNLGRSGTLAWISVDTKDHLILFDMVTLGSEGMGEGLASVMADHGIQKVVHDSRRMSDLMFHQYGVNMVNVFDTQVADVMVYRMSHHGDLPKYVHGLHVLLFNYLDLPVEQVYVQRMRQQSKSEDESVWISRPAAASQLDAAAKNVMHLRQLRQVLMERMLSDFVDGVDIYLSNLRDRSDASVIGRQNHDHVLPEEFSDLKQAAAESRQHFAILHRSYDSKGFRENCHGVIDPLVSFSHDGIWKGTSGKPKRLSSPPESGDEPRVRRSDRQSGGTGSRSRSRSRSRRSRCSRSRGSRSEGDSDEESILRLGAEALAQERESNMAPCLPLVETQAPTLSVDDALLDDSFKDMPLTEHLQGTTHGSSDRQRRSHKSSSDSEVSTASRPGRATLDEDVVLVPGGSENCGARPNQKTIRQDQMNHHLCLKSETATCSSEVFDIIPVVTPKTSSKTDSPERNGMDASITSACRPTLSVLSEKSIRPTECVSFSEVSSQPGRSPGLSTRTEAVVAQNSPPVPVGRSKLIAAALESLASSPGRQNPKPGHTDEASHHSNQSSSSPEQFRDAGGDSSALDLGQRETVIRQGQGPTVIKLQGLGRGALIEKYIKERL